MFKKVLTALLLVCACTGCERKNGHAMNWKLNNGKLKVLTTIAMINDLVQQIGGDYVDSLPLIQGELDPHSYELVKGDDEKFIYADLIFYNGLGLEHGLSLRQNLEHNPKAIAVAESIFEESPELVLTQDGQYDPHVWMDVALWMRIIDPIVAALCEKDPEHTQYYHQNAQQVHKTLAQLDERAFTLLQKIPPEKRYLVTSHDAFHYFTRHYLAQQEESDWQKRCQAPEGLAPDSQMSVSDVIETVSHIQNYQVSVLFPESNVSQDSLRKIVNASKQKGLALRLCHDVLYGDSMGEAGSYMEMISHNVEVIARELNHE